MEPMFEKLPSTITALLFSTQNFMMVLGYTKGDITSHMALLRTLNYDYLHKCVNQLQLSVSQMPLQAPTRTTQVQPPTLEPSLSPRTLVGMVTTSSSHLGTFKYNILLGHDPQSAKSRWVHYLLHTFLPQFLIFNCKWCCHVVYNVIGLALTIPLCREDKEHRVIQNR